MLYLASPHSHSDWRIQRLREIAAGRETAKLIAKGEVVYSPIVYSSTMIKRFGVTDDHAFWMSFDFNILPRCDRLVVLMLPGWGDSKGVNAEIAEAHRCNIEVDFMQPTEDYVL